MSTGKSKGQASVTRDAAEAAPNWLSWEIKEALASIDRAMPFFEHRAERNAIIDAIKKDPQGRELAKKPQLETTVLAAVGVAHHLECEHKRRPNWMTASPSIQASWFIFNAYGLPIPDPDYRGEGEVDA